MKIVFVVDAEGPRRIPTVIQSIVSNTEGSPEFHIVSRSDIRHLAGSYAGFTVTWHHLTEPAVRARTFDWISSASLDRLWLHEILEPGRYLYLDFDIICHRLDIAEIFSIETGESGMAARVISSLKDQTAKQFNRAKAEKIQARAGGGDAPGMNAGVILFDLPKAAGAFALANEIANEEGWEDQSSLNVACEIKGSVKVLCFFLMLEDMSGLCR